MKPRARALPRSSFSRNRGFYRFNNGRAACMEEPRAVSPRQRNASTQSVQKAATQWSLFRRDLIGQGFTKPFKRGRASPPPPLAPSLNRSERPSRRFGRNSCEDRSHPDERGVRSAREIPQEPQRNLKNLALPINYRKCAGIT